MISLFHTHNNNPNVKSQIFYYLCWLLILDPWQIVDECKGLPLALKVIGASLRDQPEIYWVSAKKRLSRAEPICESHESKLLERMAISIMHLSAKVRECFLDLGSFAEDKKIPLDVVINMWTEIHDIDEEEAFAILVELADKNLLTLVKEARYVHLIFIPLC